MINTGITVCLSCLQQTIRNKQNLKTSENILRGVRTSMGRLPIPPPGTTLIEHWTSITKSMKEAITSGIFAPFRDALKEALELKDLTLEYFTQQATLLLKNRRMAGAGGTRLNDSAKGDAKFKAFTDEMETVAKHMTKEFNLYDVANFELYLFFVSCLLGTATMRVQSYRMNELNDVFMDEAGYIHELFKDRASFKQQPGPSETDHQLVTDVKPSDSTLAWLMMVCVVRPMRRILTKIKHDDDGPKRIWGMGGSNNKVLSEDTWREHIKRIGVLYLGAPNSGTYPFRVCLLNYHT
jgi:hypothetical protein